MSDILITNIRGLVQTRSTPCGRVCGPEMDILPVLPDAWLLLRGERIHSFGPMAGLPGITDDRVIDATGRFVFPSFIDSHTHLIFPVSREDEFVLKIRGKSYAEIAAAGGGILNSARKLAAASDEELMEGALERLDEIAMTGTGAVEIKSGYGLSTRHELRMLRVARELKKYSPLQIRTTFLGAHAVPAGMTRAEYVDLVTREMIPAVAAEGLADYIDVFCETGFFTPEETGAILAAGKLAGMKAKVHANQLGRSGGVQAGVAAGAVSVDHLEHIGEQEIETLQGSTVMPVVLPGAAFFLNLPMSSGRKIIDEGLPLAIASDYNPGSAPSGNMLQMLSLSCIAMRLTPEEAFNAATINAACAIEVETDFGSITPGKVASVFITRPISSVAYLPYAFGSSLIERVILRGEEVTLHSRPHLERFRAGRTGN